MKFPSPIGVIFSLMGYKKIKGEEIDLQIGFRLLSELYSLLCFYSIYSDSFTGTTCRFPSPIGVIFSLIYIKKLGGNKMKVSFRLLSELYSLLYD